MDFLNHPSDVVEMCVSSLEEHGGPTTDRYAKTEGKSKDL